MFKKDQNMLQHIVSNTAMDKGNIHVAPGKTICSVFYYEQLIAEIFRETNLITVYFPLFNGKLTLSSRTRIRALKQLMPSQAKWIEEAIQTYNQQHQGSKLVSITGNLDITLKGGII